MHVYQRPRLFANDNYFSGNDYQNDPIIILGNNDKTRKNAKLPGNISISGFKIILYNFFKILFTLLDIKTNFQQRDKY